MTQITAFPDDNILRVVWWYGAIRKKEDYPIEVLLVEWGNKSNPDIGTYKVPLTDLDSVRLGSIWQGQYETNEVLSFNDSVVTESFEFDLIKSPPINIEFTSTILNTNIPYIPKQFFKLPYPYSNQTKKLLYYPENYNRSRINVLLTKDDKEVLISSIETLTTLYTPSRKDIRERLLSPKILEDFSKFFNSYSSSESGDEYFVELNPTIEGKIGEEAIVFLAHLALNPRVEVAVDKIHVTIENTTLDKNNKPYPNRYPVIEPPHGDNLKFTADGIWLNENKTRFLVLRVTKFNVMSDKSITIRKESRHNNVDDELSSDPNDSTTPRTIQKGKDITIHTEARPNKQSRPHYIKSQVQANLDECTIRTEIEIVDVDVPPPRKDEPNIVDKDNVDVSSNTPEGDGDNK
jgi:hypothetical protein